MEDASGSSTTTSKRQIIRNPYKKSPVRPKRVKKSSSKGTGKSPAPQEESETSPPVLFEKKVLQRDIQEFFKPVATWAIFEQGKLKEVQPEKVCESEITDPVADINVLPPEGYVEEDPERVRSEEESVFTEAMLCVVEALRKQEEKEEDMEHPEREQEFVYKTPPRRRLPPWMALGRKGSVKKSLPTIRRSDRVLERIGRGLADPDTEWKPPLVDICDVTM